MKHLDLAQVNQLVLRKHHLTKETKGDDIRKIAEDIVGLHATMAIGPFCSYRFLPECESLKKRI